MSHFGLELLDLCGICMRVTLQLLGVNILLVEIKTELPGFAREDMGSNSRVYHLIFFFVVPLYVSLDLLLLCSILGLSFW